MFRNSYREVYPMIARTKDGACFPTTVLTNQYVKPRQTTIIQKWIYFAISVNNHASLVTVCIGESPPNLDCKVLNDRPEVALWSNTKDPGSIIIGNDPTTAYSCRLRGSYQDVRLYLGAPTDNSYISQAYSDISPVCPPSCSSCLNEICTTCVQGYYLSDLTCQPCDTFCLDCTSTACTYCKAGYFLLGVCLDSCPAGYYPDLPKRKCTWQANVYVYYTFLSSTLCRDLSTNRFNANPVTVNRFQPASNRGGYFDNSAIRISRSKVLAISNTMVVELWVSPRGDMKKSNIFSIYDMEYSSLEIGLVLDKNEMKLVVKDKTLIRRDYTQIQTTYPKQWSFVYFTMKKSRSGEAVLYTTYSGAKLANFSYGSEVYRSDLENFVIGGIPNSYYKGFIYSFKLFTYYVGSSQSQFSMDSNSCVTYPTNSTCIPICDVNEKVTETGCDICNGECSYVEPLECDVLYCAKCSDDQCTECQSPFLLNANSCLCPLGRILANDVCQSCISNCLECDSPSTCQRCADMYYLDSSGVCNMCMAFCDICTSSSTCNACSAGYLYKSDKCIEDIPSPPAPPPDQNSDESNQETIPTACWENCSVCEKGICTSCSFNYDLTSDACVCKPKYSAKETCLQCPNGEYSNENGDCAQCNSLCAVCTSYLTCSACKSSYQLVDGQCRAVSCESTDSCTFCPPTCSACNPSACLQCINGSELIGSNCTCIKGFELDSNICARQLDLTLFPSEAVLEVSFPNPPNVLEINSSMFSLAQKSQNLSFIIQSVINRSSVYLAIHTSDNTISSVTFQLAQEVFDANGIPYSRTKKYLQVESKKSSTLSYDSTTQANSQTTTSAVLAGTTLISLFSGSFFSLMFTVNFLSMLSYIPLLNLEIPVVATTFLKSSNSSSWLSVWVVGLIQGKDYNRRPFRRAYEYGFETSMMLANMLGNLFMVVAMGLVLIILRLLRNCKAIEAKCDKLSNTLRTTGCWNLFISTFIEFFIASAIQMRDLTTETGFSACSSVVGVAVFVFLCSIPIFIFSYARYYGARIMAKSRRFTESSIAIIYIKFHPRELCYIYNSIFIGQRIAIISILVLVDNPTVQVYTILFLIATVLTRQKCLYIVIVRPHVKKAELILTSIFDLTELSIITMVCFSRYIEDDWFDQVFDIGCGSVIFGAQIASFMTTCFNLYEKIKESRMKKSQLQEICADITHNGSL